VRRLLVLPALAALILVAPVQASAPAQQVNILFSAYSPDQLDILPGETVNWTNISQRTHTVTANAGLFDSGDVSSGSHFSFTFADTGKFTYHCTIHPSIVGEIDVRRVILGPLPTAVVPTGKRIELTGRTADTATSVVVQQRTRGTAFVKVAEAMPAPDGTWKATLRASSTADVRALSGSDSSQTRRLLVSDRRVVVTSTPSGIRVSVTPSSPYARILVEVYLRERFGWWPVSRYRLDYISQADVSIERPARVRVVLVDRDGWTPLATSAPVMLRN
jgi:plastocyanin